MAKQVTSLLSFLSAQPSIAPQASIFAGRVKASIIDDKTEREAFLNFGEWSSIGSLFFDRLDNPNPSKQFTTDNFAKPLFPNTSNIPLHNELVYIMALPNSNVQADVNDIAYYYFQPINVWNSTHHNAIPDPIHGNTVPPSQTQDYEQTIAGSVRRVSEGGTEIDLGNTFKEKLSIRNLQPYAGDVIYQGRWGQSLRFGSTVKESSLPNPWSMSGKDGDPITIIKNGQHKEDKEPWIPQVEDINKDASSVYLTNTQKIPIEVSSQNYTSYSTPPETPNLYIGDQIILNSGRLLFNSKDDSILLSAKTTINLNSINSINLDSPKTVIQSKEIYLGDKNATESLILGDKFLSDFSSLLSTLVSLCNVFSTTPVGTGVPFAINGAIVPPATQTLIKAQTMLNKIQQYKSKISKSK